MGVLRRINRDHAQQRRRFLLDHDALALHLRRQAGQRDLDAVVDVDGVDVRIGAEFERHRERIAAVVAAHALHVDHLVDADDLGLDRLRDGSIHHAGIRAGVERGDRHLGGNDIGILRDRNGEQRQRPRNRGDDGDDDGQPRPVDENGGEQGLNSARSSPASARRAPPPRA